MLTDAARDRAAACSDATAATRTATDWLLGRIGDGALPDNLVAGAYRVPYALLLAGRRADAARVLSRITTDVLDESGDLRPGPMRAAYSERWSSYPLAILAQGAWHLERYRTAAAIHATLHGFQDQDTGGAFAQRPELRSTGRQDLFPTAQLGTTALTIGDRVMADGAYRWLRALYEMQPELPDRLYSGTDGTRLLSGSEDIAADPFGLVTDFHAPRQAFYNPGIAAAFLARYSAQRDDADAGELAANYLALSEAGGEQQFDHTDSVQICKFAWGAAALLDLNGGERYASHAIRMVHWFLAAQQPDGHWGNSLFLLPDGPTPCSDLEVTAEFIQHLVIVSSALGGSR
jgi:hypothetical protein